MSKNTFIVNSWDTFIGQKSIIENLKVFVSSAKKRETSIDHILFYGPPGLGKTTLAKIIATENNSKIRILQAGTLQKPADIISILSSLSPNEIVFIDEIHSLNLETEEILYTALEEGVLDIFIGKDLNSKVIRINLPHFTLIGSTTKLGNVSKPLQDRFGIILHFSPYSEEELSIIIKNNFDKLGYKIQNETSLFIAKHSKKTPRIANNLVKRIIDFAIEQNNSIIDIEIVRKTLTALHIFEHGMGSLDVQYLNFLYKNRYSTPVGLKNISIFLNEDLKTIENNIEPLLIWLDFIKKTTKGRVISQKGIDFLEEQQ